MSAQTSTNLIVGRLPRKVILRSRPRSACEPVSKYAAKMSDERYARAHWETAWSRSSAQRPTLPSRALLVRTMYLSAIDLTANPRMIRQVPAEVDQTLRSSGLGEIVAVGGGLRDEYWPGEIVADMTGEHWPWSELGILDIGAGEAASAGGSSDGSGGEGSGVPPNVQRLPWLAGHAVKGMHDLRMNPWGLGMFLDLPEEPPTLVDADLEQLCAELAMHAQLVGGE